MTCKDKASYGSSPPCKPRKEELRIQTVATIRIFDVVSVPQNNTNREMGDWDQNTFTVVILLSPISVCKTWGGVYGNSSLRGNAED